MFEAASNEKPAVQAGTRGLYLADTDDRLHDSSTGRIKTEWSRWTIEELPDEYLRLWCRFFRQDLILEAIAGYGRLRDLSPERVTQLLRARSMQFLVLSEVLDAA